MIQQDLIVYLKQAKAEGHSLESIKAVLLQQGWTEQDVNESIIAASALVAPSPSTAHRLPVHTIEKKIPDYYVSPISILLAAVLFLSLYSLTGQIMNDVESVVAPYAADSVSITPAYRALYEKYPHSNIPPGEGLKLETMWTVRHQSDRVNHLLVAGLLSAMFWVVSFVIHYLIGGSRRQYLPLSIPFFLTAGAYLVSTLFEIISRLFEKDAQYAVYITLIIFIIIVTVAFMFYQKRSHAEKTI